MTALPGVAARTTIERSAVPGVSQIRFCEMT